MEKQYLFIVAFLLGVAVGALLLYLFSTRFIQFSYTEQGDVKQIIQRIV